MSGDAAAPPPPPEQPAKSLLQRVRGWPRWARGAIGLAVSAAAFKLTYDAFATPAPSVYHTLPKARAAMPPRAALLTELRDSSADKPFDVLVIGGGATGVGVALDAVTRGLRVALIEREDFASGTSGRSTKLVHGGVRYLQNAVFGLDREQFMMVNEALYERAVLLHVGPHLSRPLPIIVPAYKAYEVPFFWAGCKLYDMVAGKANLKSSHYMSAKKIAASFPLIKTDGLKGAVVYYDGQHNDARMNLAIGLTAIQYGATAVTRAAATSLLKNQAGRITGARVRDTLSGDEFDVNARVVINATGPFTDAVLQMDKPTQKDVIVPSAGVHVALPPRFGPIDMGVIVPHTDDDRVLFFLPWEGRVIAGTTEARCDITSEPRPSAESIKFILHELDKYVDEPLRASDVDAAWAGIRPLAMNHDSGSGGDTASIVRHHLVMVSDAGLVTITGGKWTTYRRMAEDTVDRAVAEANLSTSAKECVTPHLLLFGGERFDADSNVYILRKDYGLSQEHATHLSHSYGDQATRVADLMRSDTAMAKPLAAGHPYTVAEVVYAARNEYALTLDDVLMRRTRLAYLDHRAAVDALDVVAETMARERGWSKAELAAQHAATLKMLDAFAPPAVLDAPAGAAAPEAAAAS